MREAKGVEAAEWKGEAGLREAAEQMRESGLREAADYILSAARPDPEDPYRLYLHAMPPTGWMNDPNGFCWYNGSYHLFYQCSPFSPESGLKYWGHMTSSNLLEWNHLPVALAPDCGYDRDGCYSGGALVQEGTLYLMYTGHVCGSAGRCCCGGIAGGMVGETAGGMAVGAGGGTGGGMGGETGGGTAGGMAVGAGGKTGGGSAGETQNLAFSRDGIRFEKYRGNPVIRPDCEPDPDFRDPFVWKQGSRFYCLVGSRVENHGRILLYESGDMLRWHFKSVLLEGEDDMGFMWECPGLLSFPEGDVLFLSVEGKGARRHSTWYLSGRLNLERGIFSVNRTERLDYGDSFYAPQVLEHGGQRLLVGWMDRWFSHMPSKKWGWAGAMSIPRSLTLGNDGLLRMRPVEGIGRLPGQHFKRPDFAVEPGAAFALPGGGAEVFLLELCISRGKSSCRSLCLEMGSGGQGKNYPVVTVDLVGNRLEVEPGEGQCAAAPLFEPEGDILEITVLADRSSLEVFADQGRISVTSRIYPDGENQELVLAAEKGSLRVETLIFWKKLVPDIYSG